MKGKESRGKDNNELRPLLVNVTRPKPPEALTPVHAGNIRVSGHAEVGNANADHVRIEIRRLTDPPGAGVLHACSGGDFDIAAVPNAIGSDRGNGDNLLMIIPELAGVQGDPKEVEFLGQTQPFAVRVLATACLWFAFPNGNPTGPYGEVVDDHRPKELKIPFGATKFRINSFTGTWRHSHQAGDNSGPAGLAGTSVPLNTQDYKNNYGNAKLVDTAHPFNRLVAFWEPVDSAVAAYPLIAVDLAAPNDKPAGNYKSLWLGFHDNYEWNNNDFAVTLMVEWLE